MALAGTVRLLRDRQSETGEGGGSRWQEETRLCPPVEARDSGRPELGVVPGGEPGGGPAVAGPAGGTDGDSDTSREPGRGCGR